MNNLLQQKISSGLDALDRDDMPGYLSAITALQYYQGEYGSQQTIRMLDVVSQAWSIARGRCAYCGENGTYHDPRG